MDSPATALLSLSLILLLVVDVDELQHNAVEEVLSSDVMKAAVRWPSELVGLMLHP